MSRRKILIIILLTILTILYPALIWAETSKRFVPLKEMQAPAGVDFAFSIGVGFLYFKNLRGNLSPTPIGSFTSFQGADFKNLQKLNYNKTPLFEAMISKRIIPWLSVGISFYAQSGVNVQSETQFAITTAGDPAYSQFRSNLQLYSFLLKGYVENPYPLRVGRAAIGTYFGLGVGPSWQSWTNNRVYEMIVQNGVYSSTLLSLRNKFSANATWTADAGFSIKPITEKYTMMIRLGCKYVDWGQMRQVGAMKNQQFKVAPFKPIQAKKVYSFAPYIGVNFCF